MVRTTAHILTLFVAAACSIFATEIAHEWNWIDDITESSLRLSFWIILVIVLLALSIKAGHSKKALAAMWLFCLFSTMGYVIGVLEDIPSLNQVPLIGRKGAWNQLFQKAMFAGWAISLAYAFFERALQVDRLVAELKAERSHLKSVIAERRRIDVALSWNPPESTNYFDALTDELCRVFQVKYALVAECLNEPPTRVRAIAFRSPFSRSAPYEYDVTGTPCSEVVEGNQVVHLRNVQSIYPNDSDLVGIEAEGYCGVPLRTAAQKVIGHVAIMDSRPLVNDFECLRSLSIFANKAASELERIQSERKLRQLRSVEHRVEQLENLDSQERKLATLIATGKSNEEIAQLYGFSVRTLYRRMSAVMEKLGVGSREELQMLLKSDE